MTRTYRIHRFQLVYLVLFSIGWFALVVGTSVHKMPDRWTGYAIGSGILAVLFALLPAYLTARIPHTVTVSDEGTCTFRSLVGSQSVRAQQIRSISWDEGDFTLRHDRGTVDMRALDDVEGFLVQLIELNPALEIPPGWREELEERAKPGSIAAVRERKPRLTRSALIPLAVIVFFLLVYLAGQPFLADLFG